ncbi:hypothetical protein [Oceanicola sp. S124]|uniref:hypothetical protein n=1 Tax=Oceanicola sp. S124 TaxID=1042378 RepID=UPI0002559F53|nr:hypothetical protein [Oceanicola sp. S124]
MTTRSTTFTPDFGPAFLPAQAALYGCMAGTSLWLAAFSVNMAVLRGMGFPVAAPMQTRHATPV